MLVYQATKREFMDDVDTDAITERIRTAFEQRIHRANEREVRSWTNSMQYMYKVLNAPTIPDTCGVAIEFGVPYTSSRIDFLLTGRSDTTDAAIIIELKQWDALEAVAGQDAIVRTFVGGAHRHVSHPSYQAWSYARMKTRSGLPGRLESCNRYRNPSRYVMRLTAISGRLPF